MTTLDETMTALQQRQRGEHVAELQAGPVEVLRTIRNGPDVAQIVREADGSIVAVSTATARDGRTFERRIVLAQPPKPEPTFAERQRMQVAAEIAASPLGPKMAERYLAGEFDLGPQMPVRVIESTPPSEHDFNPFLEDQARAKALSYALEGHVRRGPAEDRPPVDPLADVRERADMLADEAAAAWQAML